MRPFVLALFLLLIPASAGAAAEEVRFGGEEARVHASWPVMRRGR